MAHFLLTSTTREFRTQNLELVLKAYLSELDDVIGSQGNISLVTNRAYHLMILVFEEFNYSNIIEIRIQARHISYGRAQSRLQEGLSGSYIILRLCYATSITEAG